MDFDEIEFILTRWDKSTTNLSTISLTPSQWLQINQEGPDFNFWALKVEWPEPDFLKEEKARFSGAILKFRMDCREHRDISPRMYRTLHEITESGGVRVIYFAEVKRERQHQQAESKGPGG